jgi:hypothetical protein
MITGQYLTQKNERCNGTNACTETTQPTTARCHQRDAQHALLHPHESELGGCVRAGWERRPSVASAGTVQPLRAIHMSARSRLSRPSVLSTHGRRGVSATSRGTRKLEADRSSATRLCSAGGGRAGQATPGGADAPHSEHTHSYKVVVVNELEVNVEA